MEIVSPKDYKMLMTAIYNYQIFGTPPPEFKGSAKVIAAMIFPCLDRRLKQSAGGKRGMNARLSSVASVEKSPDLSLDDTLDKSVVKTPDVSPDKTEDKEDGKVVDDQSIAKEEEKEKQNKVKLYESESEGDSRSLAAQSEGDFYGKFRNVRLSAEEYRKIKETVTNAEDYIDRFSEKLYLKGYRYASHSDAILRWWQKDSELEKRCEAQGGSGGFNRDRVFGSQSGGGHEGSFDTNEFFEAAVRRSLGED
jgi:hypothetical protein